jgi:beta-galactosidase
MLHVGASSIVAQGVQFDRTFAPHDGLVCQYEKPAREEICLNGRWLFQGDENTEVPGEQSSAPQNWDKTPIKIPSPWNVNSFVMGDRVQGGDFCAYPSYPKSWENLHAAWMEKSLAVPKEWNGKKIVLHFGAVAGKMVVYVNGQRVGEGLDIFFAQDFDVTKWIRLGDTNQILVKVVTPKVFDKPGRYGRREYLSGSFWGTHIAGIWQDVFLIAEPKVSVRVIFVQPCVDRDELRVEVEITNSTSEPVAADLAGDVREWLNQTGPSVLDAPEVKWKLSNKTALKFPAQKINLAPGELRTFAFTAKVNGHLKLWGPDAPNLYGLVLKLSENGKTIDAKYQRFGWRQFTIEGNKFCLNGKPIVLHGDSWHFMGVPEMTRRYAYAWYRLLKDAGANAVRLHASVYPSFYHDMADEMGIMILDESAIWASDGGPKADSDLFWQNSRAHVAELVKRDRNHPSVFGWSICNEILPVLRNVWHMPTNMVDHCFDEMVAWKNICSTNDPTRPWISGDGEDDAGGRLPVINIHYGDDNNMKRAGDSGKPWAVGETSMAYYGTPKQVAKFNGNRAYESDLGRMEGLADECYGLLRAQQKYGASYQSVFNIVWYSVQPLPLGKSDLSKPIAADEGIFFAQFREGVPGMQPERLGPYTTTLNPGYDPHLPLYRPWPMFDAIRDANLNRADSPWANPAASHSAKSAAPAVQPTNAVYVVPENGAHLAESFALAGVKVLPYSSAANFLLVDGSLDANAPAIQSLKSAVDDVLARGGTIWVWNINSSVADVLSKWFGADIQAAPRVASSFVVKQDNVLLSGLDNASLYFSEDDDWRQMAFGLGGKFLDQANILLEACPADWRKWNYQGEPVKTAALFRSEVEDIAPRAAVVEFPSKRGHVILCNLASQINSMRKAEIVGQLFRNKGIQTEKTAARSDFISFNGRLMRALVCGSFPFSETNHPYSHQMPAGGVKPGAILDGQKWILANANKNGVFDFKSGLVNGPTHDAVAYVAVWIKSPKPLNDLLSEPNLPKLSLTYGSDDGCEMWLNGELLATHDRSGPLDPEMFSQNPLLLKLGWNLFVVKVVQNGGEWQFAGKFGCSDLTFLSKLEFAAQKPDSE